MGPRFWLLIALTGAGAGVGGAALMKLLGAVQHLGWSYHAGPFLDAVTASSAGRRVLLLALAGLLVGIGRWLLQLTTGGHAGELSQAIWFRSGRIPPLPTLAKSVLSIVAVGLGAAVGREGALKQAGAVAGSRLAEWARVPHAQRRLLAACGAGAGMAAAYNVPFGGGLFALEVLLGTMTLPLVLPALAASLIGAAVSWIWLPHRAIYTVPVYALHPVDLLAALIIGPAAGVASAFYVKLIVRADAHQPRRHMRIAAPILVLTALGLASIAFPQLPGNGRDVVQKAFRGEMGVGLISVLLVLRPLATAACLGSGTPGGLFTPTMTFGALVGALLGHGWILLHPGSDPGLYAILGSVAVLAASTQGPISALALAIDLTHRVDGLLAPLMVAVAGATLAARAIDSRSLYSARVEQGKEAADQAAPYRVISAAARYRAILESLLSVRDGTEPVYVVDERGRLMGVLRPDAGEPLHCETLTAADFAAPVAALPQSMSENAMRQRLAETGAGELPVVDSHGRLTGVRRSHGPPAVPHSVD